MSNARHRSNGLFVWAEYGRGANLRDQRSGGSTSIACHVMCAQSVGDDLQRASLLSSRSEESWGGWLP